MPRDRFDHYETMDAAGYRGRDLEDEAKDAAADVVLRHHETEHPIDSHFDREREMREGRYK